MIKAIQDTLFPFYALMRTKREFDPQSASIGSRSIATVFICLFFNFCIDILFLLFVSKSFYNNHKYIFQHDIVILALISILLSVFFTSSEKWEDDYQNLEPGSYTILSTIVVWLVLVFSNLYIEFYMGGVFIGIHF